MSYRPYAAVILTASAASAFILWSAMAATFIGMSIAVLLIGLQWKRVGPTLVAGWLLYLPMAVALTRFFPASWSYLASGLFAVVIPEKLTFEYEASAVLESPTGVDAETRSHISKLSRAHWRSLSIYASLALVVMTIAAVASNLTSYASELITAAMLLIIIVAVYATR